MAEGRGDIAVGNLTATDERRKIVDFVAPTDRKPVQELLVTGPASPAIATLDDLSGKTVHVRKATSYYESVMALNERLKKAGKAPVKIVALPDALEDEDMLEMLNAGLLAVRRGRRLEGAACGRRSCRRSRCARTWCCAPRATIGWAIRKDSPKLAAELIEFYASCVKKQGGVAKLQAQYHKRIKQINDNTGRARS